MPLQDADRPYAPISDRAAYHAHCMRIGDSVETAIWCLLGTASTIYQLN